MSLMTCATCADHAFTVDFCASAVTDRPSFRVPKLQSLHSIVQQRCNMCGAAQGLGAGLAPAWRRLGVVPRVVPGAGGCARGRAARQRAAATETQSNKRPWRPRIELLIRIARQHRSAPGFFLFFSFGRAFCAGRSAGRAPGAGRSAGRSGRAAVRFRRAFRAGRAMLGLEVLPVQQPGC